jgi:hypothetical protein
MSDDTAITLAQLATARMEAKRLNVQLPKRMTAISMHCKNWFLVESRDGFRKEVCAFNAYEAKMKAIYAIIDAALADALERSEKK